MLLRILLIIVVTTAVTVFSLSGCKKSSDTQAKTLAEYQDEAKEQITEENMAEELENIEKAVEQDISQEP